MEPTLNAICLVKNEDDIIGQALAHAAGFCDRVLVLDNGSSDETQAVVEALAAQLPNVEYLGQTTRPYNDGLRSVVYNEFHAGLGDEDWWMILDADEFLAEDPRPALAAARAQGRDVVNTWQVQFYYTDLDYARWETEKTELGMPIQQRRRYYAINWQEHRFFRNQSGGSWDPKRSKTLPPGVRGVASRRLLNCHYQYRDPDQIAKRLQMRFGLAGTSFVRRYHSTDWQSVIRRADRLTCREDDAPWRFTWSALGSYYWKASAATLRGKWHGAQRRLQRAAGLAGA
jgi:glycosyltransferase involved in cell wall biosynthesis